MACEPLFLSRKIQRNPSLDTSEEDLSKYKKAFYLECKRRLSSSYCRLDSLLPIHLLMSQRILNDQLTIKSNNL